MFFCGEPRGTRTPIGRLGGDCSILLSYRFKNCTYYNIIELEYQYDIINFNKYINDLSRFRSARIKCKININKIVKTIYINLTFLQKVGGGKVL